jgi:regulatory protein
MRIVDNDMKEIPAKKQGAARRNKRLSWSSSREGTADDHAKTISSKFPERKMKNNADRASAAAARPKKVSPEYLHRAALYYLQRFAATRVRLGEVLLRKVARRLCINSVAAPEVMAWQPEIEKLLNRYEESGLLNDVTLAETRVVNMRAGGRSARDITNKLRQKGFDVDVIQKTLADHETEEGINDAAAIQKFMQKKKLGAFRTKEPNEKTAQKEIATLLRAGFNYQLVKDVTNADIDLA